MAAPNDYDDDYVEISKDSRHPSEHEDEEDDDYVELVNPNVGQEEEDEVGFHQQHVSYKLSVF